MRRVAILIDAVHGAARELLRGVVRFQQAHERWAIDYDPCDHFTKLPRWLAHWRGDGIIARVFDDRLAAALGRIGVPVVDLGPTELGHGFPRLITDDDAIAKMAAEHLLEHGLRHFGYFDWPWNWCRRAVIRCNRFVHHVASTGGTCSVFRHWLYPATRRWTVQRAPDVMEMPRPTASRRRRRPAFDCDMRDAADWLLSLPRPVGIMAGNDERGRYVLAACQLAGLRVPDEIAVIAADNDELLCTLADPPLSSVHTGFERIGYAAGRLLDQLMAGQSPPTLTLRFQPLAVVARQSTDVLAIQDHKVAAALRLIHERAAQGLSVEEVLRAVPMHRTTLERRMKAAIGRTPKAEIMRVQLGRVRELLERSDLPLAEIADRVGYNSAHYLSEVFRRKYGLAPGAYRRTVRGA